MVSLTNETRRESIMKPTLTHEQLTATIKRVSKNYIEEGYAPSCCQINNGLCMDFAEHVYHLLEANYNVNDLEILCNENFMIGADGDEEGNDLWDETLLTTHWNVKPPHGMSWNGVQVTELGYHVWLRLDKMHYDCEFPTGVANFFELPIFDRYFENINVFSQKIHSLLPSVQAISEAFKAAYEARNKFYGDIRFSVCRQGYFFEDAKQTGQPGTDLDCKYYGPIIHFQEESGVLMCYLNFCKDTNEEERTEIRLFVEYFMTRGENNA
jgi:hypothetical protein